MNASEQAEDPSEPETASDKRPKAAGKGKWKRAVAWMLYKERYHTDGGAECDAGGAGNCQRQTSGMHSASTIHFYIKATNSRMMNV